MKIRVVGVSVLGVAALVAGGLALFAFDFPRVPANDMAPTLRKGDLLLACRICGAPKRGDVVQFAHPEASAELLMRRVVAVPGDTVKVVKGEVTVNGRPLTTDKRRNVEVADIDSSDPAPRAFEMGDETTGNHRYRIIREARTSMSGDRPVETLTDSYFVLSDRRMFVPDSRDFGPIARANIRSIALRVLSVGNQEAERQTTIP